MAAIADSFCYVSEVAERMGCRAIDVRLAFRYPPPGYEYLIPLCPVKGSKKDKNGTRRGGRRIIPAQHVDEVIAMVTERGYCAAE